MRTLIGGTFLAVLLVTAPLQAAPMTYAFGTVTAVEMHGSQPSVAGFEKDTGAPLSVSFLDNTNVSFRFVVSRCLPLFVTALEKPGRYYLYVTVDAADLHVQLKSCRLEVVQA